MNRDSQPSTTERFQQSAAENDKKARALDALREVGSLVVSGNALINGVPVQELVAKRMGFSNPDRAGGKQEVDDLLALAIEEADVFAAQRRIAAASDRTMAAPTIELSDGETAALEVH